MVKKLVRWIKPLFSITSDTNGWSPGFCTKEEFGIQLRKEKLRAERSGSEFVFLVLDFHCEAAKNNGNPQCKNCFASVVKKYTRESDTRGYYQDNGRECIGLILPYTDRKGALYVIEKIEDAFNTLTTKKACRNGSEIDIKCKMYPYSTRGKYLLETEEFNHVSNIVDSQGMK